MKPYYLLLILAICGIKTANAQTLSKPIAFKLTQQSVVKDSAGNVYPYVIWSKMASNGDYSFRVENPKDEDSAFIMHHNSKEEKERAMASWPKPTESERFKIGSSVAYFKEKALDGEKIDTKVLLGKVVVLNFWFIGCPPCRAEIPDLDNLAKQYKTNSDVVFVSIGLDEGYEINQYVKEHPLAFHLVDRGRFTASKFGVNLYPTNVVIDKDGKVAFSSQGGSAANPMWMKKSIDAALAAPANKMAAQ